MGGALLPIAYVLILPLASLMFAPIEQILWLAFALAWGTTHLIYIPNTTDEFEGGTSGEKTWGFGQVFPVILLALPMLSIAESYYGRRTRFSGIIWGIRDSSQSRVLCGSLLVRSRSISALSMTGNSQRNHGSRQAWLQMLQSSSRACERS